MGTHSGQFMVCVSACTAGLCAEQSCGAQLQHSGHQRREDAYCGSSIEREMVHKRNWSRAFLSCEHVYQPSCGPGKNIHFCHGLMESV